LNKAEKKSIYSVLTLYLTSTLLVVSIVSYTYYSDQKNILIEQEKSLMIEDAKVIFKKLEVLHNSNQQMLKYPRSKEFNSAIFDIDKNILFSTLENSKIDFKSKFYQYDRYHYLIYDISPYYLGAAYVVIERKNKPIFKRIGFSVIIVTSILIFIILITSLFLVKLILKPLRDNIALLDKFIKDTTHELNTPISTILSNIELLESSDFDLKTTKKINRVKTASLTLSNLYDDLVFLVLNHKVSSQDETINLNKLVEQRVEYFEILFSSKDLSVNIEQKEMCDIVCDKKKITKVIDNLISNSIKYTKKSKSIDIICDKNSFLIKDQGRGMSEDELSKIFDRYTRFDDTQGGFGIGYNIIYSVIKEYNIDIKIDSKKGEGTCVILTF